MITYPLVDDDEGKEVIMTYSLEDTGDSTGKFWTDANGRQMMPRVRNERFSYDPQFLTLEPVASNYYPVTSSK